MISTVCMQHMHTADKTINTTLVKRGHNTAKRMTRLRKACGQRCPLDYGRACVMGSPSSCGSFSTGGLAPSSCGSFSMGGQASGIGDKDNAGDRVSLTTRFRFFIVGVSSRLVTSTFAHSSSSSSFVSNGSSALVLQKDTHF